jgi:ribosomal protein L34E
MIEIDDDKSKSSDSDQSEDNNITNQQIRTHVSRSSIASTSSTSTINNGAKRQKDVSPCHVCGAKAHGYNFDQSNKIKKKKKYVSIHYFVYSHM